MLSFPQPPLSDRELSLWPWQEDDAEELSAAWQDPSLTAHNSVPSVTTVTAARSWIAKDAERRHGDLSLDMVIVERDRLAGEVGLAQFRPDLRAGVIGYWLKPSFRGRGVAGRMVATFAEWALSPNSITEHGLEMIVARCAPENEAAHRVAEQAGFVLSQTAPDGMLLFTLNRD